MMGKKENIEKAVKLVDKLSNLSDSDRRMLKKRIPEAARGDDIALADVILFPYNIEDRAIFSDIFLLLIRK